jgi:O-antigen/teichoic acid export membrane protein
MITPTDQSAPSSGATAPERENTGRLVGNVLALTASQFITTPVSMVVNALLARKLGASNFGAIYLAMTVLTLVFLFVEWGGTTQIAAEVARDRRAAPRIFGAGLVLRAVFAGIALLLIPEFGAWMEYEAPVRLALVLCGFRLAIQSIGTLCSALLRGFEKLHWHAVTTVFGSVMDATLVAGTVLSGGDLRAALTAQIVAAAVTAIVQMGFVFRLHIGRPIVDTSAIQMLVGGGFAIVVLEVIAKLQPYIDASFLARLAPPEALGWYSAATRITGVLMFPATTLTFALYPALARLWHTDRRTCNTMVRLGFRIVTILGILAATGTAIFAPLIVTLIYGDQQYAPAAATLSILSAYVLLVYATVVAGTFLVACGRQWPWALAQCFCLVVSVTLNPITIPWAQTHFANGSIGVCISVVTAEIAMVTFGLLLLPTGSLDRSLGRTLFRCLVAAAGMAAVGFWLRPYPVVAIPATVSTYAGLLWLQREMDPDMLMLIPPPLQRLFEIFQRRHGRS